MRAQGRASVLLVEDHIGIAEAFALVLEGEFTVHGVAPDLRRGLAEAQRVRPDVVVADYMLPDGKGTELAAPLRAVRPDVALVLLTGYPHAAAVEDAVEAGFDAVVWKTASVTDWRAAVRRAARGESSYPLDAMQRIVRRPSAQSARPAGPPLSAREQQVLELLASGASTADISDELVISPHTTRNHIRHVMQKLGARSRLEAVAIARRTGHLSPL